MLTFCWIVVKLFPFKRKISLVTLDAIIVALFFYIYIKYRTCVYVLGLIAKTKQGCDILKHHNWDAVRHSRRQPWPVVPDDMEQLCNELSSVPSTLSLNSESTSSRHNSESESAPSSK